MNAHKVIEMIYGLREIGKWPHEDTKTMVRLVTEAVKFEFNFGEFPEFERDILDDHIGRLRLPFPLCYFEVPMVGALLAREVNNADNYILFQQFLRFPGGLWGTLPVDIPLAISKHPAGIVCLNNDKEVQQDFVISYEDPRQHAILFGLPSLVIRGLAVLNCSNVVCVDNDPPAALNKKRLRNGKVPLFSFKTLHIAINNTTKLSTRPSISCRAGPRLHLRRGHIRRLNETRTTWVQSCVVGDEQRGIVMKNYRVT